MSFNVGDKIRYSLFSNVEIIGEDDLYFTLKDKNGNEKKIYKSLVEEYAKLENNV